MTTSMTGEQIQEAANQLPSLTPQGLGPAVEFFAILFGVVSVLVVSLRVYVRAGLSGASTSLWGIEDYMVVIGTLPMIPAVVHAVYAARFGIGTHDAQLPSPLYLIRANEYQTYWESLYFISSTVIKCAIGFTCMRLDRRRRVVVIMAVNMSIMGVVAILALVYIFANCTPFAAT
ncbi:integral membrane protein [Colletotrichum plurivorum]|uniref:Integral membrane protein n=1 Tax=Colletotrichum plurivorum TaxID=2175906 RepID=A0A8H6J9S1_9PEZI|nr:integral membrane protein [Colletotrichum plurivorum]